MAWGRFLRPEFGPFDGQLRHPVILKELAERFGPSKVFSPTALEAYVSCPFRFWLEHVLRLEPLDDPAEEVEHTHRGAAVHRALARFHRDDSPQLPAGLDLPADLDPVVLERFAEAVGEHAARAPSAAARVLWELEGKRLERTARRYRGQWQAFRSAWAEPGAVPAPHAFEADFGLAGAEGVVPLPPLVIDVAGVEVRLGGRIDRVDVADLSDGLGFWVIDYKTGRGEHYTAADVEGFRKLQLPLYALAVEKVLLAGRNARPLGMSYWMVADGGSKPVLPGGRRQLLSWWADPAKWEGFRGQLEGWVAALVGRIRAGDFLLALRSDHCTDTCAFGPVCRISQSRGVGKLYPLNPPGRATAAAEGV